MSGAAMLGIEIIMAYVATCVALFCGSVRSSNKLNSARSAPAQTMPDSICAGMMSHRFC